MSTRICTGCSRSLPEDNFDLKDRMTGRRRARCRDCVREYSRRHYEANREEYIDRAKESNRALVARKRALVEALRSRPCADCGQTFPSCAMEFDHRQGRLIMGRNSPEAIANRAKDRRPFAVLLAELEKCDILCAVCHAIRTHRRRIEARS